MRLKRGREKKAREERPNVCGKGSALRCIVGEQPASGGSEVWISASDWRRAAAVVREQHSRRRQS